MSEEQVEVDEILEHAEVLHVDPDDVLVFMFDSKLTIDRVGRMQEQLVELFGHRKENVVVMTEGATIGVVRRTEDE